MSRFPLPAPLRLAAIAAFLVAGGFAAAGAVVGATRVAAPQVALAIDPGDARATIMRAAAKITDEASLRRLAPALAADARRALRREPLQARALVLLGAVRQATGDKAGAAGLLRLSTRVTRREELAQLLLVESDIARRDVKGALRHYDTAMRTSEDADALLFPVLSRALADPGIRDAFVPYVRGNAAWLARFMDASLSYPGTAVQWADVIRRAGGLPGSPGYRDLERQTMFLLAREGRFAALRQLYLNLPGAKPGALREVALRPGASRFGVIDWQLTNDTQIQTAIYGEPGQAGGALQILSTRKLPTTGARKLLMLAPGRWRLSGQAAAEGLALDLRLTCASEGKGFVAQTVRIVPGPARFAVPFTVPAQGCSAQFVDFVSRSTGEDGVEGSVTVRGLALGPA